MNSTVDQAWQSSLGKELSKEEVSALAEMMTPKSLVDGDFLIKEGTSDDSLHVLLEGKLEVVKKTGTQFRRWHGTYGGIARTLRYRCAQSRACRFRENH
jgi:CRP-like cAMP-binding protein